MLSATHQVVLDHRSVRILVSVGPQGRQGLLSQPTRLLHAAPLDEMTMGKIKLYTNSKTRGSIIEWYVRELGLNDVEFVNVDFHGKKEHKEPDYLKINPFGRIPALVDGDLTLYESGAILLYLGEKYGGLNTMEKRAEAAKWVLFANSTLPDAAFAAHMRDKWMPEVLGALDKILSDQEFIQGAEFSVADVAMASTLWWVPMMVPEFKLDPYPHVKSYVDRMKARPAFGSDEDAV